VLRDHGVVEAQYLSMYRKRAGAPEGRRHPAALAIDLAVIKLENGTEYSVQYNFRGRVGQKTCGEGAEKPRKEDPGAYLWREIACDMAQKGSFNLVLTPHYDWGHRDHFHLEVREHIRWVLIQ
jgi:hypothetical protein